MKPKMSSIAEALNFKHRYSEERKRLSRSESLSD